MRELFAAQRGRGVAAARAGGPAVPARWPPARGLALGFGLAAALLVAAPCRAESQFVGSAAQGPLVARAHLDFRITVLPSIGLRLEGGRYSAAGTTGALVMGSDGPGTAAWVRTLEPGRPLAGSPAAADALPGVGAQLTLASP